MKKLILLLLALVVLSACSIDGDRFDGLIVVDGNGTKYELKHKAFDIYHIYVVGEVEGSKAANAKINEKLK